MGCTKQGLNSSAHLVHCPWSSVPSSDALRDASASSSSALAAGYSKLHIPALQAAASEEGGGDKPSSQGSRPAAPPVSEEDVRGPHANLAVRLQVPPPVAHHDTESIQAHSARSTPWLSP